MAEEFFKCWDDQTAALVAVVSYAGSMGISGDHLWPQGMDFHCQPADQSWIWVSISFLRIDSWPVSAWLPRNFKPPPYLLIRNWSRSRQICCRLGRSLQPWGSDGGSPSPQDKFTGEAGELDLLTDYYRSSECFRSPVSFGVLEVNLRRHELKHI